MMILPPGSCVARAWYGDPAHEWSTADGKDVTQAVRKLHSKPDKTIRANNDNFGDPARGVCKVLLIDTVHRALERTTVTLPSSGRVVCAWYGNPECKWSSVGGKDVTQVVRNLLCKVGTTICADNRNFGDPAPGVTKILLVVMEVDPGDRDDPGAIPRVRVLKQMTSAAKPLLLSIAGHPTPFIFKRGDNLRQDWAVSSHSPWTKH